MFENLEDGSDGRDEGDSWTLDTALRGLPLVCKVGLSRKGDFQRILLSLTVDDALEFGKYFWFILPGGEEGSGVAQSVGRPAPILDAFAIMRSAAADVHHPQLKVLQLKVLTTTNILLRLKNDFVKYLQEKRLGWSIDIIGSVDSISRDEPDSPLTQYITNAGISRTRYTITLFKHHHRVLRLISNRISV